MWKDFDIQLRKQQDGDLMLMTDEEAVLNSLKNIFGTLQKSRRMLPSFAVPFFNILFEPMDEITAQIIGNRLFDAITTWEDRIIVKNVNVEIDEDNLQYTIKLTYQLKTSQSSEPQVFTYILKQQG